MKVTWRHLPRVQKGAVAKRYVSGLDSLQEDPKRLLFKAGKVVKPSLQWKFQDVADRKWRAFAQESCRDQVDLA